MTEKVSQQARKLSQQVGNVSQQTGKVSQQTEKVSQHSSENNDTFFQSLILFSTVFDTSSSIELP